MLMDPAGAEQTLKVARGLIDDARGAFVSPDIQAGLQNIVSLIDRSRNFEALKTLRGLFPLEESELAADARAPQALTA
jgi:flagellar biosynthesis repressor protein FlbT